MGSIRSIASRLLKGMMSPQYRLEEKRRLEIEREWQRLHGVQRYTETNTNVLGPVIRIADAPSFIYMHKEIFQQEIYLFNSSSESPLIIDCGSNIGLSAFYFKRRFPHSRIICFEPDRRIFAILQQNIESFGGEGITAINSAVWTSAGEVEFNVEGADAGRLGENLAGGMKATVSTVRLREYLPPGQRIDMLKIDIEGAETEVLEDCEDNLADVERIFIEYHSFENQEQTLDVILTILRRAGFRFQVHPPNISRHPFVKVRSHLGMDMQLNIFGYRNNQQ